MAAIISGNNLGLDTSSLAVLGQKGVFGNAVQGRSGENVYVDVANGNLVIQRRDDVLMGVGLPVDAVRTYNSQGVLDGDNNDNWRIGLNKRVYNLTGTVNRAGSTITRTDGDGAESVYTYDTKLNLYRTTDGEGAYDTLSYNKGRREWTFVDGTTRTVETYDDTNNGRITSASDPSKTRLTYNYTGSLLTSVGDDNGEKVTLAYAGNNLTSISTRDATGGLIGTRTQYGYDTLGRLQTVTVDLTPADGSTTDGKTYTTTYTYDGTSKRVASITQADGTSLSFTYIQIGSSWRVDTMTDGTGQATHFYYDTLNLKTTVEDPLHLRTVYTYDGAGNLTRVSRPPVNGVTSDQQFFYDASGNLYQSIDGEGNVVTMTYDNDGNQLTQSNAAGDAITRTFDTRFDKVLTETLDSSGLSLTTRYAYDGKGLLRYTVSAEGRVTYFDYDSDGNRILAVQYTGAEYPTAGLAANFAPSVTQLSAWVGTIDQTQSERTDYTYDFRGQLYTSTTYSQTNADGTGVAATAKTTTYIRDAAGQLLFSIAPSGRTTAYTYDGMGRVRTAQDSWSGDGSSQLTVTTYDDANNRTLVTLANGLATSSYYDRDGRLYRVSQADAVGAGLGDTVYSYDADGRLRMVTDPTGARRFMLYDDDGRKSADIDATGVMTEYTYNGNDQVVKSRSYWNDVPLTSLVDASGQFIDVSAAAVRPLLDTAHDRVTRNVYDAAQRLQYTIDAAGFVTHTLYDHASRVTDTIGYATALTAGALAALPDDVKPGTFTAPASSGDDRRSHEFYDKDGLLLGSLDGEGYLVEYGYDAAGRQVSSTSHGAKAANPAAATLAGLAVPASADDFTTHTLYDFRGRKVGEIDGARLFTESVYDDDGRLRQTIHYANPVVYAATKTIANYRTEATPATGEAQQSTSYEYDGLGRLEAETNVEGVRTEYAYDAVGNLAKTSQAVSTADVRVFNKRYDAQGRLIGELTARGNAALLALGPTPTSTQLNGVYSAYGTTYTYDAAGRRTSARDADGHATYYYYDPEGRLRYTIDGALGVSENRYNGLGQLETTLGYGTQLVLPPGFVLTGGAIPPGLATLVAGLRNIARDSMTTTRYNVTGTVHDVVDGRNFTTTYDYDAFGEVKHSSQQIDSLNTRALLHDYTYDHRGLQTDVVWSGVNVRSTTHTDYDAFGRIKNTTDTYGVTKTYTYDRVGRTVTLRQVGTDGWTFGADDVTAYDAFGRVLSHRDHTGATTQYTYDTQARTLTTTSPENVVTVVKHDEFGATVSVQDGNKNVTTYTYDLDGNLKTVSDSLGAELRNYDAANLLRDTTDRDGNVVHYDYDGANRVMTRTVDPNGLGLVTRTEYDGRGERTKVTQTSANGAGTTRVVEYAWNGTGQLETQTIDPTGLDLVTRFDYDGLRNQLTVTDPGNNTVTYDYDDLGRRTGEHVGNAALGLNRTYEYDKAGNVIAAHDALGVTRYFYDANDHLGYVVDAVGDVTESRYDAAGRVTQTVQYGLAIDPAAVGSTTKFADVDTLVKVTLKLPVGRAVTHVYDNDGREVYTIDGGNGLTARTLDANGNVILQRKYATALGSAQATDRASLDALVAGRTLEGADDRVQITVYDALNRARYTIDGAGGLVEQRYDGIGNVIERLSHATPVGDVASLVTRQLGLDPFNAPLRVADMPAIAASLPKVASDRDEHMYYDKAGRLSLSFDGTNAVTAYEYDNSGNVTKRIAYAARFAGGYADPNDPVFGASATTLMRNSLALPNPNVDRIETSVYDAANRLSYASDGTGAVTGYRYLTLQNQVVKTAYAIPVPAGADPSTVKPDPYFNPPRDRVTRTFYDSANRVALTIDGEGGTVRTLYDGASNALVTTAYANKPSTNVSDTTTLAGVQIATSADDRITRRAFDAASRLRYEVDGESYVKRTDYDALGRIQQTVTFAAKLHTPVLAAALDTVAPDPTVDRIDSFHYDAEGRLLDSTDALGHTEHSVYDAVGNKLSFENKLGSTWTYGYDAAGRMTSELAPSVSTTTLMEEDGVPAPTQTDVALLTTIEYDALGQVVTRTETPVVPTFVFHQSQDMLDILAQNESVRAKWEDDAVSVHGAAPGFHFVYVPATYTAVYGANNDQDGLHQIAVDAHNASSVPVGYTWADWDGANGSLTRGDGDQYTYATADGRTATFTFHASSSGIPGDAAEEAQIARIAGESDLMRDVWTKQYLANIGQGFHFVPAPAHYVPSDPSVMPLLRKDFDDFFNLFAEGKSLSWGSGTLTRGPGDSAIFTGYALHGNGGRDVRTTRYEYDAAGRQTKTTFPSVMAAQSTDGSAARAESLVTPSITVAYDAFGDAAAQLDAANHYSYKVYDNAGRIAYEVDAEGYATYYARNAFGDAIETVRFVTPVDLSSHVAGTPITLPDMDTLRITQNLISNPDVRFFVTGYDRNGRSIQVSEAPTAEFDSSSSFPSFIGKTTYTTYNAFGDVIMTLAPRNADGSGSDITLYYYNGRGDRTGQVDALGYVTTMDYDAAGNLVTQMEYDTNVTPPNGVAPKPGDVVALPSGSDPDDRLTTYEYDLLNRKQAEVRHNVEFSTQPDGTSTRANVRTTYGYDWLGNLTRTTDATGASTYTYYDALGRIKAITAPQRTDAVTGASITPIAVFKRDTFGNVVEKIDYSHTAANVSETGYDLPTDTTADRATFADFDAHGNAIRTFDATGHEVDLSYDVQGNVVKKWEGAQVQGNAGAIVTTYQYDALGRQTHAKTYGTSTADDADKRTDYNAFGEVTATFTNDTLDAYFDYDTRGQLWRTNSGDGVGKLYLYDRLGALTAEIRADATVLRTFPTALSAFYGLNGSAARTEHVRDALGRETSTIQRDPPPPSNAMWLPDPNRYLDFKTLVDTPWQGFYGMGVGDARSFAGGQVTRGEGDTIIFRTFSGGVVAGEWTLHLDRGPLVALSQVVALRGGITAATGINFVQGSATSPSYVPMDFPLYWQMEKDFNDFFANWQAYASGIPWMGGTLVATSADTAEFRYADVGKRLRIFQLNRSDTPLGVMQKNDVIRAGWQREYGVGIAGPGGEEVQRYLVRTSVVDTQHLKLSWTPLDDLGSGDIQYEVRYLDTDGNEHSQTAILSSEAGADGTIVTTEAPASEVTYLTVSKKDAAGDWIPLIEGYGTAFYGATVLTVPAATDPATQIKVQMRVQGTGAWTDAVPRANFGDRILYMGLPNATGNEDYQVVAAGVTDPLSSGVIAVGSRPLQALPPAQFDPSTATLSWTAPQSPTDQEVLNYSPVFYKPTSSIGFSQLVRDYRYYFDHPADFSATIEPWGDGKLVRVDADTAVYIDGSNHAYTLRSSDSVLDLARRSPALRAVWEGQYAQFDMHFVEDTDGWYPTTDPAQLRGFDQLVFDFDDFFTNPAIPATVSRYGGTFTRIDANTGSFTYGGETVTFSRDGGPFALARLSDVVRKGWDADYGMDLEQGHWSPLTVSNHSASFANVGEGTYEYELLFEDSTGSAYAHTAGTVTSSGGNAAVTIGESAIATRPIATASAGVNGTVNVELRWSEGTFVVPTLRYRPTTPDNSAGWIDVPVQAGTSFDVQIAGLQAGSYDYELSYSSASGVPPYAHEVGTLTVTAAVAGQDEMVPALDATLVIDATSYGATISWPVPAFGGPFDVLFTYTTPTGESHDVWLRPHPGDYVVSLTGIPAGTYSYSVTYYSAEVDDPEAGVIQPRGTDPLEQTHGTFTYAPGTPDTIVPQNVQHIDAPLALSGTDITWTPPPYPVTATFLYQPAGTTGWTQLPVDASNPFQFAVHLAGMPVGSYSYELLYTWQDSGMFNEHQSGTFTYAAGAASALVPDNPANYAQLPIDFDAFFQYRAAGYEQDWMGGALVRGQGDTAHFAPGGAFVFEQSQGPQYLLLNNPTIRQGWSQEFGLTFTYQPEQWVPNDFVLWNGAHIMDQIATDTQAYFDSTAPGDVRDLYGGVLVRGDNDTATVFYTGGSYTFSRSTTPQEIANESAFFRNGWASDPNYRDANGQGLVFTDVPEQWVPDNEQVYETQLVQSFNDFFTHPDIYPAGGLTPWFGLGTFIRGEGDFGYFVQGSIFDFTQSEGVPSVAARNTTIRQGWEAAYHFQFVDVEAGIVDETPQELFGDIDLPGVPPSGSMTQSNDAEYIHVDPKPATANLTLGAVAPPEVFQGMPLGYSGDSLLVGTEALSISNSSALAIVSSAAPGPVAEVRTVAKSYDRWGNVRTVSDARNAGWVTSYTYNAANEVLTEAKPIAGVDAFGNLLTQAPVTHVYYDQVGRQVAMVDANGNRNGLVYDAAGQVVSEIHADTGVVTHTYDAFGERTRDIDALSQIPSGVIRATGYAFDKDGRLVAESHPQTDTYSLAPLSATGTAAIPGQSKQRQSRIDSYLYDAAGRRISSTDGAGDMTHYQYDTRGNILATISGFGSAAQSVDTAQWDTRNRKFHEQNANGDTQDWRYVDSYDHLSTYRDLSGRTTTYFYDALMDVDFQQVVGVNNLGTGDNNLAGHQDLRYTYDAWGRLTREDDIAANSTTTYAYDEANNRIGEKYEQDGIVYQDNENKYDAQGRLSEVVDARHHLWVTYDAVGNRREVKTNFTDDSGTFQQSDNWYAYDAMNRMTVENGVLGVNGATIGTTQGTRYHYDVAGNKDSAEAFQNGSDITTYYTYDEENRLTRSAQGQDAGVASHVDGLGNTYLQNTTGTRQYDAAGRVESEVTVHLDNTKFDLGQSGSDDRADDVFMRYDAQGRLLSQVAVDYQGNVRYHVDYNLPDSYDAVGNLKHYFVSYRSDYTEDYKYQYGVEDSSYHQSVATVHGTGIHAGDGETDFTYDANIHLKRVYDQKDGTKNRRFVNDETGNVLARVDGLQDSTTEIPLTPDAVQAAADAAGESGIRIRHSLVVNGETVGLSAMAVSSDDPAIARFDFGAQSAGDLGNMPGRYIVTQNDVDMGIASLQSLSQAVYGDASLWYAIAEANGIGSAADLKAGMTLVLPNAISSAKNDFRTFKPFDPSVVKGDIGPSLPKPAADNGCGTLGIIIVAIVAIVVTIATEGAATSFWGSVFGGSGTAADIAGAATAAAAGNIAGQAVGNAIGVENGFSWKSVATAAVSAGITEGMVDSHVLDFKGVPDQAATAARAAVNSAVNQGVGVIVGTQKRFSWTAVAASAVAAPIGDALGKAIGGELGNVQTDITAKVAKGFVYGVTTQAAVKAATGGRVKWESIAADAFGNALGSSLALSTPTPPEQMYDDWGTSEPTTSYSTRQRDAMSAAMAQGASQSEALSLAAQIGAVDRLRAQVELAGLVNGGIPPALQDAMDQVDLSLVSKDSYFPKGIPELLRPGIRRINDESELHSIGLSSSDLSVDSSGYFASVYHDDTNQRYIIANRGTELSWSDIAADFTQAQGWRTAQYQDAVNAVLALRMNVNEPVIAVGHSLGGGEAAAQALATSGVTAYTFNAAGLSQGTIDRLHLNGAEAASRIRAFSVSGEVLNFSQDTKLPFFALGALSPAVGIGATALLSMPSAIGERSFYPPVSLPTNGPEGPEIGAELGLLDRATHFLSLHGIDYVIGSALYRARQLYNEGLGR